MNPETRQCQNCKKDFVIESEDFNFYKKINVPPPTWCPECRLQRRLAQRNERNLYKRPCDLCKKDIITIYSPDKPFKSYCPDCYYSDGWDPLKYGRDYDFSRPFFEQWKELQRDVPHLSLFQQNSVNSPWINYELDDKNCYLNFGGHINEDCAYNQYLLKSKDCFDNFWHLNGQFAYETILSERGYKIFNSIFCYDCRDTYFSFDCRGCSNIFGCSGLRHKQYHIFNKPVSKENFEKFMRENRLGSYENFKKLKKQAENFWKTQPQRTTFVEKSVNVTGNQIKESKNCKECWNVEKTEDSKYMFFALEIKNGMDVTSVWWAELAYEFLAGSDRLSNIRFSTSIIRDSVNIEYSHLIINCNNCFGCIDLRNKNFCILNKQYSKEEYEKLRGEIIKHMNKMPYTDRNDRVYEYGEFFPYEFSPYGYNETVAYEYFPLTKEEATKRGFNWNDYEADKKYEFSEYKIPDDIRDVKDDILEKVLKSEISDKAYRIIPMELSFYRRMGLPIPRQTPFERHHLRLKFIADHLKLHGRNCGKCGTPIDSVYTENEFPTVYCGKCYLKEII